MPLCCYDGFSDDMGQIRSDGEIPIKTHSTKRRTRDKTSAYTEESAQGSDQKPHHDEVDWTNVRLRDWKYHVLFRAAVKQTKQRCGQSFQQNRLADDEGDGNQSVEFHMVQVQLLQPIRKIMDNKEEIACY